MLHPDEVLVFSALYYYVMLIIYIVMSSGKTHQKHTFSPNAYNLKNDKKMQIFKIEFEIAYFKNGITASYIIYLFAKCLNHLKNIGSYEIKESSSKQFKVTLIETVFAFTM